MSDLGIREMMIGESHFLMDIVPPLSESIRLLPLSARAILFHVKQYKEGGNTRYRP